MKSHFNPHTIANTLLMLGKRYRCSYLVVEGNDDVKFFSNLTNEKICRTYSAFGKSNVIDALKELNKRGAKGFLGIIDSDYCVLEGIKLDDNLLFTDTHDIETMILISPALEKVLKEFLPGDRLEHNQNLCIEIRQELIRVGLPIGFLRWMSHKENFEMDFGAIQFDQFFDYQKLSFDIIKMIQSFRSSSRNRFNISYKDFEKKLEELNEPNKDPWHICQGHDLIYILKLILPVLLKKFINYEEAEKIKGRLHQKDLEEKLRLAYEFQYFANTKLYISIRCWESTNKSNRILP